VHDAADSPRAERDHHRRPPARPARQRATTHVLIATAAIEAPTRNTISPPTTRPFASAVADKTTTRDLLVL
jgi:hypothetical protein